MAGCGAFTLGGGLVGAVLAAAPGLVDFFSLKNPHMKRIGTWHLTTNVIIVLVYGINLWIRVADVSYGGGFALSTLGILLLGLSGWLGGELVYKHGVAVDTQHVLKATGKSLEDS